MRGKDRVAVIPSLVKFDPCTCIYNPQFDLGIGEEWLPKQPVIKSPMVTQLTSAIFGMRYVGDENDEFLCSFDVMKDSQNKENIATFSSAAVSTTETWSPPTKQSKLSLSLKNDCKAGKMPPNS